MGSFTILLVEDYEPFRRFVCSTLQKLAELRVIQASDGLEAIEKAKELQPDSIVFDLGLPKLNGLEAARRVRELAIPARILFLSQEFSVELVQEAFSVGAQGYVHKLRAQSELLPAIEAVLKGERFVGSGLQIHEFSEMTDARTAEIEGAVAIHGEEVWMWGVEGKSEGRSKELSIPKHPWQQTVVEAFQSRRDSLSAKINVAERAIATRLRDADQPDAEERLALKDALRSLKVLLAETRPQAMGKKEKRALNG
jgi:DNA-binding NarL/FixJ family response regulator